MHIRQVALVAQDLEPVVEHLCAVFGLEVAFNDPGVAVFGLRNAVMPVGDTFLEVVTPVQPDASAARYLERRKGDGGYMVILQTDDLDADRQRLEKLGVRIVWEIALPDIATLHLHPRDIGGAIVSLDQPRPPESWRWAGPEWERRVRTEVVGGITGVEIQTDDPRALASRWAEVLGTAATVAGGGEFAVQLARGWIRMVPPRDDRGEGIAAVELRARDHERIRAVAEARGLLDDEGSVEIGGVRFWLSRTG